MCSNKKATERLAPIPPKPIEDVGPETKKALQRCEEEILGGLKHGFFEFAISCEIVRGKKRWLVLKAGRSYCFVIPEEEIASR
jgi:hypothetical protein